MVDPFLFFIIGGFSVLIGIFFFKLLEKRNIDQKQSNAIQDLERRITDLMNLQLKEIRGTVHENSQAMMSQVRSFTRETTDLKKDLKDIHGKVKDISSFQEIFRSPKLRGQWGEASLVHVLSQHFPSELYKTQYLFSSGVQVDAVLKLPDGKILPIDAKFSSESFERMIGSSREEEKKVYCQKFVSDIKQRIEEITSKYILPQEGTVDFALMYIPAEAVYYETMLNLAGEDLAKYAWKRKVAIVSPNTIYLTLRTIENWFRDTQISKRTQEILKKLERINQDARILTDDFRKLGRHLKDASSAHERSEKRLSLFEDRVERLIETDDKKQLESDQ